MSTPLPLSSLLLLPYFTAPLPIPLIFFYYTVFRFLAFVFSPPSLLDPPPLLFYILLTLPLFRPFFYSFSLLPLSLTAVFHSLLSLPLFPPPGPSSAAPSLSHSPPPSSLSSLFPSLFLFLIFPIYLPSMFFLNTSSSFSSASLTASFPPKSSINLSSLPPLLCYPSPPPSFPPFPPIPLLGCHLALPFPSLTFPRSLTPFSALPYPLTITLPPSLPSQSLHSLPLPAPPIPFQPVSNMYTLGDPGIYHMPITTSFHQPK